MQYADGCSWSLGQSRYPALGTMFRGRWTHRGDDLWLLFLYVVRLVAIGDHVKEVVVLQWVTAWVQRADVGVLQGRDALVNPVSAAAVG
jgi:hypothetical protein